MVIITCTPCIASTVGPMALGTLTNIIKSTFEYEKCTKTKKGKQKFALFF